MNYAKLNEVDVVNSMSDSGYVLGVDETGDIKRVPKNVLGKVKTVNNVEPDENGNITVQTGTESKIVYVDIESRLDSEEQASYISTDYLTNEQLDEIYNLMSNGKIVLLRARNTHETSGRSYTHPTDCTVLTPSGTCTYHNPDDYPDDFIPYCMQWIGFDFHMNGHSIKAVVFNATKKRPEDAWYCFSFIRTIVDYDV